MSFKKSLQIIFYVVLCSFVLLNKAYSQLLDKRLYICSSINDCSSEDYYTLANSCFSERDQSEADNQLRYRQHTRNLNQIKTLKQQIPKKIHKLEGKSIIDINDNEVAMDVYPLGQLYEYSFPNHKKDASVITFRFIPYTYYSNEQEDYDGFYEKFTQKTNHIFIGKFDQNENNMPPKQYDANSSSLLVNSYIHIELPTNENLRVTDIKLRFFNAKHVRTYYLTQSKKALIDKILTNTYGYNIELVRTKNSINIFFHNILLAEINHPGANIEQVRFLAEKECFVVFASFLTNEEYQEKYPHENQNNNEDKSIQVDLDIFPEMELDMLFSNNYKEL